MAQNTRPYPPDPLPAIDEDELCAAQRAIDAVLTLVRTKNWLDDVALCGAEDEMAQNNLLLRVVAIPVLKGFVDSNGGVRASDVEQIATDLETLISSKFEQGEVSVNATRGIARGESPVHAEGEYGQVMVQISATLPDDTSVEDLARVRQDVALAMSDCAKGDMPGQEVTLDIQSVDGNSAALVHALCRAICIPSIMMQAAQIEAAMRVGTTRVVELTADPEYGIFKYF